MELEKLARQLGAAIQQDKVYLDFEAARKANDADEELNALMGKIRLIQLSYQQEAARKNPTKQKWKASTRNSRACIHRLWQTKICRNLKKRARRSMK